MLLSGADNYKVLRWKMQDYSKKYSKRSQIMMLRNWKLIGKSRNRLLRILPSIPLLSRQKEKEELYLSISLIHITNIKGELPSAQIYRWLGPELYKDKVSLLLFILMNKSWELSDREEKINKRKWLIYQKNKQWCLFRSNVKVNWREYLTVCLLTLKKMYFTWLVT